MATDFTHLHVHSSQGSMLDAVASIKDLVAEAKKDGMDALALTDHGTMYGGLVTTTVNGKPQEMIKLVYKDNAAVFVSIHNLHRISKYKGKEGTEPTISRLGSGAWERLKERTKERVKDIARDLIKLYATRKQQQG